jgi:hypothetical protein
MPCNLVDSFSALGGMYAFILHQENDGNVFFGNACYCLWDYTGQSTAVLIFTALRTLCLIENVFSKVFSKLCCWNIHFIVYDIFISCYWTQRFFTSLSGSCCHNLLLHMILTFYKLFHSNIIIKDAVSDTGFVFDWQYKRYTHVLLGPLDLPVLVYWGSQIKSLFYVIWGRGEK